MQKIPPQLSLFDSLVSAMLLKGSTMILQLFGTGVKVTWFGKPPGGIEGIVKVSQPTPATLLKRTTTNTSVASTLPLLWTSKEIKVVLSPTLGIERSRDAGAVVNDHVKSDAKGFPARSVTPEAIVAV